MKIRTSPIFLFLISVVGATDLLGIRVDSRYEGDHGERHYYPFYAHHRWHHNPDYRYYAHPRWYYYPHHVHKAYWEAHGGDPRSRDGFYGWGPPGQNGLFSSPCKFCGSK